MSFKKKLNALKIYNHLLAFWALFNMSYAFFWVSFLSFLFFQIVGANIAMHRYLGHGAFKASRIWDAFLVTSANLLCFGDSITFVAFHRYHHQKSETDQDPHSPSYVGFINIVLGNWRVTPRLIHYSKDLTQIPIHLFFRKYYFIFIALCYLLAYIAGGLPAIAFGLGLPLTLVFWTSIGLTYICHLMGYRNYATNDTSFNNRFVHILTLGDGMHNNHHHAPKRIYQGNNWSEFDVTGFLLKIFVSDPNRQKNNL
jgi:fatty-acid desaturase